MCVSGLVGGTKRAVLFTDVEAKALERRAWLRVTEPGRGGDMRLKSRSLDPQAFSCVLLHLGCQGSQKTDGTYQLGNLTQGIGKQLMSVKYSEASHSGIVITSVPRV